MSFPPVVSDAERCVSFSPEWEAGGFVSSPDGQHAWELRDAPVMLPPEEDGWIDIVPQYSVCRYCGGRKP